VPGGHPTTCRRPHACARIIHRQVDSSGNSHCAPHPLLLDPVREGTCQASWRDTCGILACRDEAACGQARTIGGPSALAAVLFDASAQASVECIFVASILRVRD